MQGVINTVIVASYAVVQLIAEGIRKAKSEAKSVHTMDVAGSLSSAACDAMIRRLDFKDAGNLEEFEYAVNDWFRQIVSNSETEEDFDRQLRRRACFELGR